MPSIEFADHRQHLKAILDSVRLAADPAHAVQSNMQVDGPRWTLGGNEQRISSRAKVLLLAAGKAAAGMTSAALDQLGDRTAGGIVVLPHGSTFEPPQPGLERYHAGHPLPDAGSLAAGQALDRLLAATRPGDVLVCLLSGGASAMLELPLPGITLQDLTAINQRLLLSGAPIHEINRVRKALSGIKGGRLLTLAAPARVIAMILSDVVGDNLADVGSGPTVDQNVGPGDARQVLEAYGLLQSAPGGVVRALSTGWDGTGPHPPPLNVLVGSNRMLLEAAARTAGRLGFRSEINPEPLQGEAREAGAALAAHWLEKSRHMDHPWAHISGGETTVTVRGHGNGGRNQELALAAALHLEGGSRLAVMSYASDGVDGPTDAAGAIVTPETPTAIRRTGMDPGQALDENDAWHALDAAGGLLRTGPSGTNLNDVLIALGYSG